MLKHLDHITLVQLDAVLVYYAAYPEEIDQQITENTPSAEELVERYPFVKTVSVKGR